MIRELNEENERLKKQLAEGGGGGVVIAESGEEVNEDTAEL
jgi:hypothetical protein